MKKICSFIGIFILCLEFCFSSSRLALISVTGNRSVPWQDENSRNEKTEGAISGRVNDSMNKNSFERQNAVSRLDYVYDSLKNLLSENENLVLCEKDEVLKTKAYSGKKSGVEKYLSSSISAQGFRNYFDINSKSASEIISECGSEYALCLDFQFRKIRKNSKNLSALVIMKVRVIGGNGKDIFGKKYSVQSEKSVPLSGKSYNNESLEKLIHFTIDSALEKFLSDFISSRT